MRNLRTNCISYIPSASGVLLSPAVPPDEMYFRIFRQRAAFCFRRRNIRLTGIFCPRAACCLLLRYLRRTVLSYIPSASGVLLSPVAPPNELYIVYFVSERRVVFAGRTSERTVLSYIPSAIGVLLSPAVPPEEQCYRIFHPRAACCFRRRYLQLPGMFCPRAACCVLRRYLRTNCSIMYSVRERHVAFSGGTPDQLYYRIFRPRAAYCFLRRYHRTNCISYIP